MEMESAVCVEWISDGPGLLPGQSYSISFLNPEAPWDPAREGGWGGGGDYKIN